MQKLDQTTQLSSTGSSMACMSSGVLNSAGLALDYLPFKFYFNEPEHVFIFFSFLIVNPKVFDYIPYAS